MISNNKNDFWKSKNVFVTGAGGFIGSHLVEELVKKGANVSALVHYNSRNDWGLLEELDFKKNKNIKVVIGDIRDQFTLKNILKDQEYIFHLAALIGIPYSYISPNEYISTNIQGTANIFQICHEYGIKKIIHTSTSEVYGTAKYTPIDENHPLQGQSPYSASKIAADMIAQSYSYSFNVPSVILRPFNTFGPRQSSRAIIPTIISQALYNSCIEVGSLNPKRDFNYVKDTVQAFLLLGESSYNNSEIFNCATGKQISIGDLIKLINHLIGKDLPIIEKEERVRPENSEVLSLIGNADSLRNNTTWKNNIKLIDGLKMTMDYIKNNENFKKNKGYVI